MVILPSAKPQRCPNRRITGCWPYIIRKETSKKPEVPDAGNLSGATPSSSQATQTCVDQKDCGTCVDLHVQDFNALTALITHVSLQQVAASTAPNLRVTLPKTPNIQGTQGHSHSCRITRIGLRHLFIAEKTRRLKKVSAKMVRCVKGVPMIII